MKNVFITGIAGFIGYHTALALLQQGHLVLGIDNFNTYYDPHLKKERAACLIAHGAHVIEADMNDRVLLHKLCDTSSFTHVLHLAAQAGVRYAEKHPDAYLHSNINGFLSILETVRQFPHIPLIYASSSSVYGCNQKTPFSIEDRTDAPANLYAATKKANELMAFSYHHLYQIRSIGLRFFTVYGPWGRPDMAYYSFTRAILEESPIHLYNQGTMQRDFTYIDDIVEGILQALDYESDYELFNLGNQHPIDVMTFLSLLEECLGKKAHLILDEASNGEIQTTHADITQSTLKLGFQPKVSLREGLKKFTDWYVKYTA